MDSAYHLKQSCINAFKNKSRDFISIVTQILGDNIDNGYKKTIAEIKKHVKI